MYPENREGKPIILTVFYICLFIVSIFFMLCFSRATSPLYEYYGLDSPIFIVMGKMLVEGKTLYVDCFDHKGPILFFIQGLGQWLAADCRGIFFLQVINLFLTLVFLTKAIRIFTSSFVYIIFGTLLFLFLFSFTIEEGNQTEEWSMLFIFLSIYVAFKYYYGNYRISDISVLLLSFCFSSVFWIRPNNAGVICACIAFIFIVNLRNKNWKFIGRYAGLLLAGFVLYSGIISLYFIYKGAFWEMIYSSFIFNFKYMNHGFSYSYRTLGMSLVFNLFVLISLSFSVYTVYKKEKDKNILVLFLLLLVFGFIPVNMIKIGLFQYKSLLIPVVIIAFLLILHSGKSFLLNKKIFILLAIAMLSLMSLVLIRQYKKYKYFDSLYIKSAHELVSNIPLQERNNTFGYQTESKIYVITALSPVFKYFIFQEFHGQHDRKVINEINEMLENEKPLWIFTQNDLMENSTNKFAQQVLINDYDLSFEDKFFKLYRLRE